MELQQWRDTTELQQQRGGAMVGGAMVGGILVGQWSMDGSTLSLS